MSSAKVRYPIRAAGSGRAHGATPGGPGNRYHYQWFFQEHDVDETPYPVSNDSRYYSRDVAQRRLFWFFWLIVTLEDTVDAANFYWADSADMMIVFVDGRFGSLTAGTPTREPSAVTGLVDTDGICKAIPDDRAARQALFRRLWYSSRPIQRCDATVEQAPRPAR